MRLYATLLLPWITASYLGTPRPTAASSLQELAASLPPACVDTLSTCISQSSQAIQLASEQRYCDIAQVESTRQCLLDRACTEDDVTELVRIACAMGAGNSVTTDPPSNMTMCSANDDYKQLETLCPNLPTDVTLLLGEKKFCQAYKMEETENCFRGSGCSSSYDDLKKRACSQAPGLRAAISAMTIYCILALLAWN